MKKITCHLCALLLFLLPLKFGGLAVMPDAGGFFPLYFSDWLFVSWHPHSLAFFSSAILAMALVCCRKDLSVKQLIFASAWNILPLLAVLPGMIRGDDITALGQLSLLAGCGTLTLAILILVNDRKESAEIFIGSLFAGGMVAAFYGWYQYLYNISEMQNFVAEQEAAGIHISEAIKIKLTDPRVYSTLGSSNTFASFLMILAVLGIFSGKKLSKYVTPPEKAAKILCSFFTLFILSVLLLTRSRSAVACPVIAAATALLSFPKLHIKWKIAGLSAAAAAAAGGLLFASYMGRPVASMTERADYLRTCAILCKNYPLAGGGWGEFFQTHMTIKVSDVDESARDPHNVIASFASQCGIPAGILIMAAMLLPLAVLWKHRFENSIPGMVFWCGILFSSHSLIDCDWQIPALLAAMGSLYACAFALLPEKDHAKPGYIFIIALPVMLCGIFTSYYYIAGDKALAALQDKISPQTRETAAALKQFSVEELADKASSYRPGQPVIPMLVGNWYMSQHDFANAEKHFLEAIKYAPRRPSAYARLAEIAMMQGEKEKAEKLMKKAHSLFPKSRFYKLEKLYGDKL